MAGAATNAANASDEMDVWVGHLSATTKVMSETVLTWAFCHLRLLEGSLPVLTPRLAFAQQYRPSAHVVGADGYCRLTNWHPPHIVVVLCTLTNHVNSTTGQGPLHIC
jgi:hypothetical protein